MNMYDAARRLAKANPGIHRSDYPDEAAYRKAAYNRRKLRADCLDLIDQAEDEGIDITAGIDETPNQWGILAVREGQAWTFMHVPVADRFGVGVRAGLNITLLHATKSLTEGSAT